MSGLSLNVAPNIAAFAAARGLRFSREEIASLSDTLNSMCRIGDDKQVSFVLDQGRTGTIDDALCIYAEGMGRTSTVSASTTPPMAGMNATERAIETNRVAREGSDALKRKQAEDLVKVYGSPWAVSGNMTHAAYIQNVHPKLAERLRAEAGVHR